MYIYYRFGRPPAPGVSGDHGCTEEKDSKDIESQTSSEAALPPAGSAERPSPAGHACHSSPRIPQSKSDHSEGNADSTMEEQACHHSSSRPFWATVTAGVFHCGAGCVLGDIVGDWIVYGSNATINGQTIWVELLLDYAFALLFGIVFQYFSIAPMSGKWGPLTFVRAAKADVLSLTSFEIGAFGWMVAYQVGIFNDKLDMATWTYWWLMQVGMALGVVTAWPVNWWLLRKGIKEACC